MLKGTCNRCLYFLDLGPLADLGRCRRYPPEAEPNRWPVVDRRDVCGEFKPAPSEEVDRG